MRSEATTVEEYLNELPPERREMVASVRDLVLRNMPEGYVEVMRWGMITYEVPLEVYPDTYNGEPLSYAAIASQKNHVSLYLMAIYNTEEHAAQFREAYLATGKRMDVGKSCVRFRKLDDLPMDVIAEAVAAVPMDVYVTQAKEALAARKKR